jgi:transcriptional regulator GlxA family with amidase domain
LAEGDAAGREVAEAMGMGYENFRKQFTKHMGVSPGRYRERLRVERAKLLLRGKRLGNKELAEILGYCDEAHFSKAFKRLAGVSPRAYSKSEPAEMD